jgi:hypothetical protein
MRFQILHQTLNFQTNIAKTQQKAGAGAGEVVAEVVAEVEGVAVPNVSLKILNRLSVLGVEQLAEEHEGEERALVPWPSLQKILRA